MTNKLILAILINSLCISAPLFCQKRKVFVYLTGGPTLTILDYGWGATVGINSLYQLNSYLQIENQLSYNRARIQRAFISGKSGFIIVFNGLGGIRLYFNPKDEYRFFINGLIGVSYQRKNLADLPIDGVLTRGISVGAYFDFFEKYTGGLCLESPNYLVLRFGYKIY